MKFFGCINYHRNHKIIHRLEVEALSEKAYDFLRVVNQKLSLLHSLQDCFDPYTFMNR